MEPDLVKFWVVLEAAFQVGEEGRVVHADGLVGPLWEEVVACPENGHIVCGRRPAHDDHAITDPGLKDGWRGSVKRLDGSHVKFSSDEKIV